MANLKNLQQAANVAAGKVSSRKQQSTPVVVPVPATSNSRSGKIAITFHLPEDFKRSMRLVQAQRGNGCTLEGLAEEAFNDLFTKYNVPTVTLDK